MAIDSNSENLISLTEAAKLLPTHRGAKRPRVSCLYRWTTAGCKGVILESIQISGTRCASREALARFFEALSYGGDPRGNRRPSRRQQAASAAERGLEREGG